MRPESEEACHYLLIKWSMTCSRGTAALRQQRSHVTLLERRSDENRAGATPLRRVVRCQVTARNQTESSE